MVLRGVTVPLSEVDREMLQQLLAREPGSWARFVDRFGGLVVQVIRQTADAQTIRLSADDQDDLCSEVFTEFLDRDMSVLQRFRRQSSLATYLAVVARRVVVRSLREQRYRRAFGHVDAHQAALDVKSRERSASERAEDLDRVEKLMQVLSQDSRDLLQAIYLEGLSYAEAARKLDRPINSIGPLLSRIRSQYGQLPGLQ
ncbi:MAG: RNA polymerase sigma factor [Planctomycetaceae bacterium]